ncbi:uracil-DNA glycosylase [Saccharothrix sp. NRRL B-16314]|uniref:uracil-DNA glycosylase n=1 Tax=Saccharothrix sp. NRRL B-16314 TaxID=1463825 RepID=UPI000525C5F1|nr:uracil-DNA glycosylase [Saccharothrix sp. NRRL B-16314]
MPARANKSTAVVQTKLARLGEPHIAPLVALADEIARSRGLTPGDVPYPDPDFAGVDAEALVLLKSPGPGATKKHGSGLLSPENNDPTAARAHAEYERVGVDWHRVVHWNTVPWPTATDQPSADDLRDARAWLPKILDLVPGIKAVLLMGVIARDEWNRPGNTAGVGRRVHVITSPMPSPMGLRHVGAHERVREAFDRLAEVLA